ncbi:MAG: tetratricopeptide repeat protein [Bacteroidales bacterium]
MIKKSLLFIILLIWQFNFQVTAQQTKTLPTAAEQFRLAETLFELEKYAAARTIFESIADQETKADILLKTQASYYVALCAAELDNKDAEYLFENFISTYNKSSMLNQAWFNLGSMQFKKKNYRTALKSFNEVSEKTLSNKELAELYFKKGYCYMRQDDFTKARQNFNQLRNTQTYYTIPATYYYAHLAYIENDLEKALNDLNKIRNQNEYRQVIPYYLVHIYYKQGQYDKVTELGEDLYTANKSRQNLEIGRMIGDSYYKLGNYDKSLSYLENYYNNSRSRITRGESYQMGYLYLVSERYQDAIRYFQSAIGADDSISQYSYFNLANAYLKTDQKQYAGNAFHSAYRLTFNLDIREEALFNYAKLSLENSSNPYNEPLKALNQYIEDYPDGKRRKEALTYLVHLYLSSNNYREALASIENIKEKDKGLNEAYQRITYNRGIELFNDKDYFNAMKMFKKSQENNIDQNIFANSLFWTGESYFRLSQYDLAISYYNRFLSAPGARNLPLYHTAHYNIGYSWFQQKKYDDAVQEFKLFLKNESKENSKMVSDAYMRTGDSYFVSKRYQDAISQYDKAARLNSAEADYATFQKARALGALGKQEEKIATLRAFQRQYSSSPYAAEAFSEMGNTSMIINQNNEALQFFNTLIVNYPASNLIKTALMKTGLIYYNLSDYNKALDTFKKVVAEYPGSQEAHEAIANIRNIYVDLNRVDEFIAYSKNISFAQITDREQDSLLYFAALNKYMENDCASAKQGFSSYLNRFPQGLYSLNSNYYKADCEFRANNMSEALLGYENVLSRPRSEFTERSLQRAAKINQNLNNYAKAREQYNLLEEIAGNPSIRLEAINGQLFTSTKLEDHQAVLIAAEKLLKDSRVPETSLAEIHLIAGKSAMALSQTTKATESYKQAIRLSPQGSFGAEASYHLASILYEQNKLEEAENIIFDLAANYASYDYWVASGFILLADIYKKNGNIFQARQTLLSVVENHQGEELRALARKKLNELPKEGDN